MLVCVICGIFATMNDERLSRHITQDNLRLRSDNSQLKKQMEEKDIMLNSKDDQILSLLNQIATDMVKRSDVDEIVKKAVSEEHDRLVSYYEGRMRSMAAEYEAKIAELKKGRGKKGGNGGNSVGSNRKPNTQTFDTKEEAVAALEEAQKKALAMADQAFGKGSEKLTAEQKPATDPQEEAADDDSKVKSPVQQRGDYGEKDYVSTPRSTDYCQYGDVDDDDITHNYFFPEGCDANSAIYGERTDILPILGDILQELNHYATSAAEECGSLLMKAIHYAMAEWNGLMRYTSDGRYRADNNMTEQLMRDLASGRKNFLFSGSDEAAKNFAFAYSLTQSCKLNHANPYAYWEDLIANAHNPNRTIDSFMPHLWGKNL